jgi:hypothetical protein
MNGKGFTSLNQSVGQVISTSAQGDALDDLRPNGEGCAVMVLDDRPTNVMAAPLGWAVLRGTAA